MKIGTVNLVQNFIESNPPAKIAIDAVKIRATEPAKTPFPIQEAIVESAQNDFISRVDRMKNTANFILENFEFNPNKAVLPLASDPISIGFSPQGLVNFEGMAEEAYKTLYNNPEKIFEIQGRIEVNIAATILTDKFLGEITAFNKVDDIPNIKVMPKTGFFDDLPSVKPRSLD